MKTIVQTLTVCFALLIAALPSHVALAEDFVRYQVILDRKPFGEPPPDSTNSNLLPGAQSFIKDIRMVAITEDGNGDLKVGFVDIKANKSYYLAVGDSEDEIQVVDADYGSESALLKKGTDEQWVNMNAAAAGAGAGTQSVGQPGAAVSAADRTPAGPRMPYARRRDSARFREAEPPKLQGEALEKQFKEYNMELLRAKGEKGPPLPIPLTPEQDAQLVEEGVLPPADQTAPAEGATETAPPAGE